MKTWDIFDTLIARRCIYPQVIFNIVSQVTHIENFPQIRIAAEQNLARHGVNYNLDDIYEEISKICSAPKNLCDELKSLEVQVELDNCIPITENLRQVKAGDVLISDMYLPENVIRKMLYKAGLFEPVEIVVTSGGKATGRIWKEIADQNEFVFHIGDNMETDIKKTRQYGFDSALTILSQPNQFESYLMQRDFPLASYLREIRLKNPFSEEIKRKYWTLFTMNVGILIILAQLIDKLQQKYAFEYLGFCGRDTYYLWLLYKKFKDETSSTPPPPPPVNDYLYYSRKLAIKSKSDVEEYFISKIKNRRALMIDLTGTGTHLHSLRNKGILDYSLLMCFCELESGKKLYSNKKNYPENWIPFDSDIEISDLSSTNFYFSNSDGYWLEFLNRATHNTPVRLNNIQIDKKFIPKITFSEINDTENFDVIKDCIKEVLKSKIVWGNGVDLIKLLNEMIKIYIDLAGHTLHNHRQYLNDMVDIECKTFDEK